MPGECGGAHNVKRHAIDGITCFANIVRVSERKRRRHRQARRKRRRRRRRQRMARAACTPRKGTSRTKFPKCHHPTNRYVVSSAGRSRRSQNKRRRLCRFTTIAEHETKLRGGEKRMYAHRRVHITFGQMLGVLLFEACSAPRHRCFPFSPHRADLHLRRRSISTIFLTSRDFRLLKKQRVRGLTVYGEM